jgi:hypothetical protein
MNSTNMRRLCLPCSSQGILPSANRRVRDSRGLRLWISPCAPQPKARRSLVAVSALQPANRAADSQTWLSSRTFTIHPAKCRPHSASSTAALPDLVRHVPPARTDAGGIRVRTLPTSPESPRFWSCHFARKPVADHALRVRSIVRSRCPFSPFHVIPPWGNFIVIQARYLSKSP